MTSNWNEFSGSVKLLSWTRFDHTFSTIHEHMAMSLAAKQAAVLDEANLKILCVSASYLLFSFLSSLAILYDHRSRRPNVTDIPIVFFQ